MKQLFALIILSIALQGCFFVVGAAAGAAAVTVVYDHRSIERVLEDTQIGNTIVERLKASSLNAWNASHIEIAVFNHVVLLSGETPYPDFKERAERIANSVRDVSRVYNQVSIQGATSSLTRTSDTWITAKIKTQMLATDDLKSSSIKVITENGAVYLMGIVSRNQADMAVEIARQASGVQKVVKVFQYRD